MPITLQNLNAILRRVGRGVICESAYWDGTTTLTATLAHLGDTEGEITAAFNETYNVMTLPELTGEAEHVALVAGENPVVTVPMFYADPALRAVASPTGTASGGFGRQQRVQERTMAVIPEELFSLGGIPVQYGTLDYQTGTGWTLSGTPLNAAQLNLLGVAVWFWKGYWRKGGLRYRSEEAGKLVEPLEWHCLVDTTKPEGQYLYTIGDPAIGIDIDPIS